MAGNSLKAAPRREVLEVERLGDWGEIRYAHTMSCGHVEQRPRRTAPGRHMACSGCLRAASFSTGLAPSTPPAAQFDQINEHDYLIDDVAGVEAEIARLRAGLATTFGVPVDAVDVAMTSATGIPEVAYALVFLDADTAKRKAKHT